MEAKIQYSTNALLVVTKDLLWRNTKENHFLVTLLDFWPTLILALEMYGLKSFN